ncbi:hypothetical protein FVB32_09600 [Flagellimonas hymeniacidonis]|uniref:Membrane metalloprotease n=1 Tax=Flagellimonas hymeniacidonis TaxID=2603628 RepID=A0A5C8V267_9FLAO|nr:hypothetical protein [Flagellimonas hymeniacidonis]TXN34848.1 hypothetical protein FVB32_09600 [Flagellimonas hymeniacidonis]
MKKKIAIYSLFCLGIILGCSKDSENPPNPQNVDKTANLQATGSSANDILSNANFDKLLIEIDYVDGFQPTGQTVANFEDYLRERTFKTDIEFIFNNLSSPNEESLTLEEIADLESDNRDSYNDGRTLAIYIYFADSPSDGDDLDEGLVTLGAVYRNTSMIIYESTIRDLASRSNTITVTDVETATLNHEFGHLFGLVNLGTDPVNDHEDPDAENHCNVTGCLMRAELQFGVPMMKMMESNASKGSAAVPVLDAECILDLQSNGGR